MNTLNVFYFGFAAAFPFVNTKSFENPLQDAHTLISNLKDFFKSGDFTLNTPVFINLQNRADSEIQEFCENFIPILKANFNWNQFSKKVVVLVNPKSIATAVLHKYGIGVVDDTYNAECYLDVIRG